MRIIFILITLLGAHGLKAQTTPTLNRGTGAPTYTPCPVCAWVYLDNSTGTLYTWTGAAWVAIVTGGGTVTNPLTSDLDMNNYSITDGDNDEIYFSSDAWNWKSDSIMIRKPTAYTATDEFNIWFPSTVFNNFAGIGIYSRDGGGISEMNFYTSKISGTYAVSKNMNLSKDQAIFYVPTEFQAGNYSYRATTGASSYLKTALNAYSFSDLGTIASGGNTGVSGVRFGAINAGSNNLSRAAIFAEYNSAFGANMVFQVGRRGDIAYTSGDGLRFMEVTETSATSGVSRITFPAASEVIFLGAIKDKDSQTGSNGQVMTSTGTSNDWKSPSDLFQGISILVGTGSPEGVQTANVGSLYMRTDGGSSTTLYVKESGTGSTGWVAK